MEFEIIHDKINQSFYSEIEGRRALLDYIMRDDEVIDFTHTYVPIELRGKGIAAKIVREGLEYAKENNFKVIPSCSYVEAYIDRHPEYHNILAEN